MFDDALADVFHYDRKPVAADVRMGVNQNRRVCTKAHKLMEHFTDVSPL